MTVLDEFKTYLGGFGIEAEQEEIADALGRAAVIVPPEAGSLEQSKPIDSTAHRTLLADAVGRMSRRISRHANDCAKNPTKLWAWLDDLAAEREAFADYTSASVSACLAHLGRTEPPADVCAVLSGRFFAGLADTFKRPANEGEKLPETVARLAGDFERTIAEQLVTYFFEGE